jgi:endoglucanase
LLIFVQGVENYEGDWYWWGGNLKGVAKRPIILNVPNRVVYSPHDYGPDVFLQGWFTDASFPNNLPNVWDQHWGYIQKQGIAPVVLGEFGGRSVSEGAEGAWQRALLDYLQRRQIGFINWTLNPNSSDTGGLLSDDWQAVLQDKQDLYRQYLAPPIGDRDGAAQGAQPNDLIVFYHSADVRDKVNNVSFFIQVFNDTAQPVELSRIEVRYWFSAGDTKGRDQLAQVDWSDINSAEIHTEFVPLEGEEGNFYLRITFGSGAGSIAPYSSSAPVLLRFHKSDWSDYTQSNDYSFGPVTESREWDRITLYVDGRLVWGREPENGH